MLLCTDRVITGLFDVSRITLFTRLTAAADVTSRHLLELALYDGLNGDVRTHRATLGSAFALTCSTGVSCGIITHI